MLFSAGDVIQNVEILRYVGAGAFGEVYHARDKALDRECAVKYVENKDPVEFKAHIEAQVLHRCRHDRVVDVFDVVTLRYAGRDFAGIEMEYLPDGSCEAYLEKHFVTVRTAVRWMIDILYALEHAHSNNVLHRDIKPANFLIKAGCAKLSDFGLAKVTGPVPHGSAGGTPVYAAPELFSVGTTSIVSDIFSAGMSLFQLVSNLRDWKATSITNKTIKKGEVIKEVGFPEYVPRKLQRICLKACRFDPAKRYKSAREMRQALEALRVQLDWCEVGVNAWSATVDNTAYAMSIAPTKSGFVLTYQVNGRRKNAKCTSHGSMAAAIARMHDEISTSYLK